MLRATNLTLLAYILLIQIYSTSYNRLTQQTSLVRRLTTTTESAINLNPTLSEDGSIVSFESSADLAGLGGPATFRCIKASLVDSRAFAEIARTRCIAPSLSRNSSQVAFASNEDLLSQNPDRNSEIYLSKGPDLRQITSSVPTTANSRLIDGSFQPSISEDGRFVAFSSNQDLIGDNADHNFEIFLFDASTSSIAQLTSTAEPFNSISPKISGNAERIAFLTNSGSSVNSELMLYERAYQLAHVLVTLPTALSFSEGRTISHDGLRIVYSADTGTNQSQVFLCDISQNINQQLTALGSRSSDVKLNATISGDGKRVAFATRRRVGNPSDGSVELYVYDIPSGQTQQVTNAPSTASSEVVSSLNYDGSLVAFNFARVLSDSVTDEDFSNNSEIYIADIPSRPAFGFATAAVNAASNGNDPAVDKTLAPGSIVTIRGSALARRKLEASLDGQLFPLSLAGTSALVDGVPARMIYISSGEVVLVLPDSLPDGPAEIVLTNADGFASKAFVKIKQSSPGLFTFSGDGRGNGVIFNADNFVSSPLDPTDGHLRLVAFGTGLRFASDISARINGENVIVENVLPSSVQGLDEVRLLVPNSLRGAGLATLSIIADASQSNSVTISLAGSALRDIMINEFLADPPDGLDGDANLDGVRSASADEFVEVVNATAHDFNIGRYQLLTLGNNNLEVVRHSFPDNTILPAGTSVVVFGGGNPNPTNTAFGGAQVFNASSGALSLINGSGSIILRDNAGTLVSSVAYGPATAIEGVNNQSITRSPDIDGPFTSHSTASKTGKPFSPGTTIDGSQFVANPPITSVEVTTPVLELRPLEVVQITARALDADNRVMDGVLFKWQSSDSKVATIDFNGVVTAVTPGIAQVTASARGVSSTSVLLRVVPPSPSPSPSPSSTPVVTPTPLSSPSPSPNPVELPPLVISEFRTRGPSGANDEFVEIYNLSNTPTNIGGLKLRASNSSGSMGTRLTINPGTTLPGHAHFLATNSSGYSGTVHGNQSFSSGITNDGGIALTLADDTIIDQIGMSPGSAFKEGIHLAPLPSDANQSYERRPGGKSGSGVDTNKNFDDFFLTSPSDPQNLDSPPTPEDFATPSPSATPTPTASPSPSPKPSTNPSVVISQVYGGGGNSGAPYRNDFIEIFNRGEIDVDLSGWSIQYSGATSATWSVTNLTTSSLAPGQFYLIREASGGPAGMDLPPNDVSGSIAMSASAGKLALVKGQVPVSGVCPADPSIVDLLGYGNTATCFRGSGPAAAPSNSTALLRKTGGCSDSGNNTNDFQVAAPNPRNTSSTRAPCSLLNLILRGWPSREYQFVGASLRERPGGTTGK